MTVMKEVASKQNISRCLNTALSAEFDFYDVELLPFSVYGVFREGGSFVRMPRRIAEHVSEAVAVRNEHTAGGRIRFVTDSSRIALVASVAPGGGMPPFAYTGVSGFDLYGSCGEGMRCFGTFVPQPDHAGMVEGIVELCTGERRTIQINMPLYNCVKKVYIGVEKGCVPAPAAPLNGPPIVYYGSSITQGGCASRPGNSYQAMVHKDLETDYLNLGFSGSALAEAEMMAYIASLPMQGFVYDYDHNAPTVEHLEKTHYQGYRTVRAAQPDVPILMLSRPKIYPTEEEKRRKAVIRASYEKALAEGDGKVFFIDGAELLDPESAQHALVDNCHPADIGFLSMAKRIEPVIRQMIK